MTADRADAPASGEGTPRRRGTRGGRGRARAADTSEGGAVLNDPRIAGRRPARPAQQEAETEASTAAEAPDEPKAAPKRKPRTRAASRETKAEETAGEPEAEAKATPKRKPRTRAASRETEAETKAEAEAAASPEPEAEAKAEPKQRAPRRRRAAAAAEEAAPEPAQAEAEEEPKAPARRRTRARSASAASSADAPATAELAGEVRALREALTAQAQTIDALREIQERAVRRLRLGVFVDVPNLIYGAERGEGAPEGASVDMGKLLAYLSEGRELIRATAYAPVSDDPGEPVERQRFVEPFVRYDYRIVTKPMKRFADGSVKGNFDVEMALDMVTMADRLDVVSIVSGDADFARAVELLQTQGVRVEVIAFSGSTSIEMRALADEYVDVATILDRVGA